MLSTDNKAEKRRGEGRENFKVQLIKFFRDVAHQHLVTHPVTNTFTYTSFLMLSPNRKQFLPVSP